jgi:DNA-directed RNA polymerase specialized sigma24 family protein
MSGHAEESAWLETEEIDQVEPLATISPDLLQQVENHLAPQAQQPDRDEYQRRLAGDIAVVRAIRADGYTGERADRLMQRLAAYGWPVLHHWITTGEIFAQCTARGRPISFPPPHFPWTAEEHSTLATETLLTAVPFFRRYALQQGHWDPRRGAGLTTYFMGACVSYFAVTYRKWWKQQHDDQRLAHWDDSEALIQLPDPRTPDPCHTALVRDEASRTLTRIQDPKVKEAMGLRALGYTEREAAESVGLTAKALERRSSKQRAKLRRTDAATTDCLGEGSDEQ